MKPARRLRRERARRDERARRRGERARRGQARSRAAGSPSPVLRALTSSALALPGLTGGAAADAPPDRISASYDFSIYREDEIASSKVAPGSERDRYEIEIHQLRLAAPIGDRFDVSLDLAHETMSGATPWYVIPGTDGDPIQVMTGATIQEERTDALLSGRYHLENGNVSLGGGISTENDYFSVNGSLATERHFNEKNTTLSLGTGLSIDRIEPTDGGPPSTRPTDENKQSYSVFAGISQVVGRSSVLQTSLAFSHDRGFLSDPYKQALVAGTPVADTRPDTRNQVAWLTRYRHHVSALDGTLHADYRLYVDDWNVTSHTLEVAWYQSLWDSIRIIPSFRYYSQSQAEFYAPYYDFETDDALYSSDYRLSPFGAVSWKLRAETQIRTWRIDWLATVSWERYLSSGDWALGKVSVENPGLVSYQIFSVGLKARF